MKIASILSLFLMLLVSCQSGNTSHSFNSKALDSLFLNPDYSENFDSIKNDNLPSDWIAAVTGTNTAGKWEIIDETKGKSVGQTSKQASGYLFNLLILKQFELKDLALSVKMIALDGKEDQGGGLVWRFQDADNYYIARANPLENNFRVYKVIGGNRIQLKSYSLPVTAKIWHTISIIHNQNLIQCYYDQQLFLETIDSTIIEAGKVGLWTKADALTNFDDFIVKNLN